MLFFRVFVLAFLASLAFLHVDHLQGHLQSHEQSHSHGHAHPSGQHQTCQHDGVRIRDHRSALQRENAGLRHQLRSAEAAARHAKRIAVAKKAVVQAAMSAVRDSGGDDTRLVDVKRSTIEGMLAQPEVIGHVRVVERLSENGQRGLGLAAIQPGSVFELLGLRNGDIVLNINDTRLDGSVYSHDLIGHQQLPDFVDIAIERRGRPMRILVLLHD